MTDLKEFITKTDSNWHEGGHYKYRHWDEYVKEKTDEYIKDLEAYLLANAPSNLTFNLITETGPSLQLGYGAAIAVVKKYLKGET